MYKFISARFPALVLSLLFVAAAHGATGCPDVDLYPDCEIDIQDVMVFAGHWLEPEGSVMDFDREFGVNGTDFAILAEHWGSEGPRVVINEVLASNTMWFSDDFLEYEDWIELFNPHEEPVDVGGMWLTDELSKPGKWQIPADSPGRTTIPGRGYLVIWADDEAIQGPLHAPFELDAGGEEVGLFDGDGVLIDAMEFPEQETDTSFGRYPDGSEDWRFLGMPTGAKANYGAFLGDVDKVEFSHSGGVYDEQFMLTMSCETPGAKIYYSLDGSEPYDLNFRPPKGTLYTGPILIQGTRVVRGKAVKSGWRSSEIETNTYLYEPSDKLASLPIISLVGDASTTFYGSTGIMGNFQGRGKAFERPVSFEWMLPDDVMQVNCGIRVHGSDWMRPRYDLCPTGYWYGNCKISFRLYFRNEYGPSRLNYPLLPWEVDSFKTVTLRGGHNDRDNPFIKDELIRRLYADMGNVSSRGTFANLMINGEYKGYYNPCEHIKTEFCQDWWDTDNDFDIMTMNGIRDGDSIAWSAMINFARDNNISIKSNYDRLAQMLDIEAFADYLILRLWSGDWDWPQNNWSAAREKCDDGRWQFFVWDAEGSMFPDRLYEVRFGEMNSQGNGNCRLYQALKYNQQFRQIWTDRLFRHFYNGGVMTEPWIRARFEQMQDELRGVISNMNTYAINTWVPQRLSIFKNACINEGLYSFDGPTLRVNNSSTTGGYIDTNDNISITNLQGGTIYYTLDGSDPRTYYGSNGPSANAVRYTNKFQLSRTSKVRARILSGGTWSAEATAVFAIGDVAGNLRITELMYHPMETEDPEDPNEEFIELQNVGSETINLNLVELTRGVRFTFGPRELAPGDYVLVVRDLPAFEARYGAALPVVGQYERSLSNGGERVRLEDAVGSTILDFKYSDDWYKLTDGDGFSLTVREPAVAAVSSWGEKDTWRSSALAGGSPGDGDAGALPEPGAVVINEILAHSHDIAPDWIELHNTTNLPIDIGGWYLSDDDSSDPNRMKYRIPDGTTIQGNSFVVLYENQHFNEPRNPDCRIPFALSENGDELVLSSADGSVLTGYRDYEDFGASPTGIAFGRYYKASTDNYNFVLMSSNTPGMPNAYPMVGPVVINEIMYNPASGNENEEYIELLNITSSPVAFYDYSTSEPWKFVDGIEFVFGPEPVIVLGAGQYMLVVKDLDAFVAVYGAAPSGVSIFEYDSGRLDNGGERLELAMPGDVNAAGERQYIRVDRVNYSDGSHPVGDDLWPVAADGAGMSLSRISESLYGNDVANWRASPPTPGYAN